MRLSFRLKENIRKAIWFVITLAKSTVFGVGGASLFYVFLFKEIIDTNALISLTLLSMSVNFLCLTFNFNKEWDEFLNNS